MLYFFAFFLKLSPLRESSFLFLSLIFYYRHFLDTFNLINIFSFPFSSFRYFIIFFSPFLTPTYYINYHMLHILPYYTFTSFIASFHFMKCPTSSIFGHCLEHIHFVLITFYTSLFHFICVCIEVYYTGVELLCSLVPY